MLPKIYQYLNSSVKEYGIYNLFYAFHWQLNIYIMYIYNNNFYIKKMTKKQIMTI